MSHRSGSRTLSARLTRRFSAARSACSSWSTDSLPLSGDFSSENSSIRSHFFGVVANATPFLSLMQGSPARRWQTRRVCFMLGCRPRWNSAHQDGMSTERREERLMSPQWWHESLLSVLAASFLFREQPRPSRPPAFFLPGTYKEKAAGQRISALGDEWAYAGCTPAYLTLSPQRVFTCSLHQPGPASLCGCEQSGLIRWKQWRRDRHLSLAVSDAEELLGSYHNIPRGLVLFTGSERCLLLHPDSPLPQAVLEIRLRGSGLSIHGPPLRAVPGYPHFYEVSELPRRLAHFRPVGVPHPLKMFQRMLGLMASASSVLQLGLLQYWLKPQALHHGRLCVKNPQWTKRGVPLVKLNLGADMLSRSNVSSDVWMLHPQTVQKIWGFFGRPKVNLFTSKDNTCCQTYF